MWSKSSRTASDRSASLWAATPYFIHSLRASSNWLLLYPAVSTFCCIYSSVPHPVNGSPLHLNSKRSFRIPPGWLPDQFSHSGFHRKRISHRIPFGYLKELSKLDLATVMLRSAMVVFAPCRLVYSQVFKTWLNIYISLSCKHSNLFLICPTKFCLFVRLYFKHNKTIFSDIFMFWSHFSIINPEFAK